MPKFQPLYYTESSKSAIYLLSLLAIIFSPMINIVHGTYFAHKVYSYYPNEYDYDGLVWDVFVCSLVNWWIVKPLYIKIYSNLTWTQVLYASQYLFLTFVFFTYPAVTGAFGSLLREMFVWGFQLFTVSQYIINFSSFLLTSIVGITICELCSLRCGHLIENKDIFYWSFKELISNAVIVTISLLFLLWDQGYIT